MSRREVTPGARVLKGRWVYAFKKDKLGRITFVKARYTVMGCFQTEGVDYDETFAPVMTIQTFRTVLQLVNLDPDSVMEQWDISNAYIHSKLEEKVFCEQPQGHEDPNHPGKVWLLQRSLYGLKQSGRNFHIMLKQILAKAGAKPIPNDPGSFILKDGPAWCIMPVVVDDLFPAYNKAGKKLRDKIAKAVSDELKVKFQGELEWALKMRVFRDKKKGIMKLSQESYIWEFLSRHGLLDVKGVDTPAEWNVKLPDPNDVTDKMVEEVKDKPFRELIGGYLWISRITRPDIAVATHMAARCQHRPSKELWKFLVRIADT